MLVSLLLTRPHGTVLAPDRAGHEHGSAPSMLRRSCVPRSTAPR